MPIQHEAVDPESIRRDVLDEIADSLLLHCCPICGAKLSSAVCSAGQHVPRDNYDPDISRAACAFCVVVWLLEINWDVKKLRLRGFTNCSCRLEIFGQVEHVAINMGEARIASLIRG